MKLFLDFDDVIFDTKQFLIDMKKLFISQGVPENVFVDCYYDKTEKDLKIKKYNPHQHLERIARIVDVDKQLLHQELDKFTGDTSLYIYADVKNFLSHFKKQDLFLVSHGYQEFQEIKINNSGIRDYFYRVVITDKLKNIILDDLIKKEKIGDEQLFFVDDRVPQIEEVKKVLPQIKTILLRREEGRYNHEEKCNYCDFEATNFNEVLNICQKIS